MRKQRALLRDVTNPPPLRRNVHARTGHLAPPDLDRSGNRRARNRSAIAAALSCRCPTLPKSRPASLTKQRDRRRARSAFRRRLLVNATMRKSAIAHSRPSNAAAPRAIGEQPSGQKREQEHHRLEGRRSRESQTACIGPDFRGQGPRSDRGEQQRRRQLGGDEDEHHGRSGPETRSGERREHTAGDREPTEPERASGFLEPARRPEPSLSARRPERTAGTEWRRRRPAASRSDRAGGATRQ